VVITADVMDVDRLVAGIAGVTVTAAPRLFAAYKRWNIPKI
jgi:hypothetical protein